MARATNERIKNPTRTSESIKDPYVIKYVILIESRALFIRSVKNFVRHAYFCFLKQKFERPITDYFQRAFKGEKWPAYEIFYAGCKQD